MTNSRSIRRSSRRSLLWLVPVLLVAALFVRLGFWQLDRLEERREFNAALQRAQRESPQPLAEVLAAGSDSSSVKYRRVITRGTFLVEDEMVLYGRSLNGEPGNHLLTPLSTDDGKGLIVDRGWVPIALDRPPVFPAAPPDTEIVVTGVLFPSEGTSSSEETTRATTVTRVDVARISATLDYGVIPGVYLRLQSQKPPQQGELPRPVPLPEATEGPHLGYAIQWFSFAVIALVGSAVLAARSGPSRRGQQQWASSDREARFGGK